MQVVWNYCKGRMVCEPDEPKEENDQMDVEEVKKGHGGCGAAQPLIRKEGLKLFVQYKRSKDEDEVCLDGVYWFHANHWFLLGIEIPAARQAFVPATRSLYRAEEDLGFRLASARLIRRVCPTRVDDSHSDACTATTSSSKYCGRRWRDA